MSNLELRKNSIIEKLDNTIRSFEKKQELYWITKEDLIEAISMNIAGFTEKNTYKKGGSFQTCIVYSGYEFMYVGDKIEI